MQCSQTIRGPALAAMSLAALISVPASIRSCRSRSQSAIVPPPARSPQLPPASFRPMRSLATAATATSPRIGPLRFGIDTLAIVFVTLSCSCHLRPRLNVQPLVGEETRWATGARDARDRRLDRAAATGPRLPRTPADDHVDDGRRRLAARRRRSDRDPAAERHRGRADVAARLWLHAAFSSTIAATVAALAYATMGQVLQIGRQGESEALFALLVGASLLVWHLGYMRALAAARCVDHRLCVCGLGRTRERPASAGLLCRDHEPRIWPCGAIGVICSVGNTRPARRFLSRSSPPGRYRFIWPPIGRPSLRPGLAWPAIDSARWRARTRHHVSGRNVCVFACLVADPGRACETRDADVTSSTSEPVTTFLFTALLVAYPTVWFAAGRGAATSCRSIRLSPCSSVL